MIAAPIATDVPSSRDDERAATIHARLDDECDRAIARDDERDELRGEGGRRER